LRFDKRWISSKLEADIDHDGGRCWMLNVDQRAVLAVLTLFDVPGID